MASLGRVRETQQASEKLASEVEAFLAEPMVMTSSDDLADADQTMRAFRKKMSLLEAELEDAKRDRTERDKALVDAKVGERKMELLVEAHVRNAEVAEKKAERTTEDEHAARRRRTS